MVGAGAGTTDGAGTRDGVATASMTLGVGWGMATGCGGTSASRKSAVRATAGATLPASPEPGHQMLSCGNETAPLTNSATPAATATALVSRTTMPRLGPLSRGFGGLGITTGS